jgi:spermidine/putrescine transport system ATP-binding protein
VGSEIGTAEKAAAEPRAVEHDGLEEAAERGSVRLENASKTYPGAATPAAHDLNVVIRSGEFFSLLGPSGSGKTTTLRLIAGFERPTTGRVFLGGREVTNLPPYRRPVHTVFQNYALFPHMNVWQNVAYPLRMRRRPRQEITERVARALERIGMEPYAKRMPHQLSGGQRQRIALARALVGQPEVVLLDEPLGALDLKLRQDMQLMLQHIQRDVGITFVYVTHDQGEALAMSDRIAIMSDGVIHQVGSPNEVYSSPATAFVASFVGKTNLLDCAVVAGAELRSGNLRFHVAEPPAGSRCIVSLRPETLRLGRDADSCPNRVTGLVEEAIFQGSEVELRLRVEGHQFIARAAVGLHHVGEHIQIGWQPSAAIVVDAVPTPEASAREGEPGR